MIMLGRGKAKERDEFRLGVGSEEEAAVHTGMRRRESLEGASINHQSTGAAGMYRDPE